MKRDVVIVGGGAAGLMCAIRAGLRGRSVTVLEHSERIGKKILISGGGRCNFTNVDAGPENYVSASPHFCKSALARYRPQAFIALVEKHGIAYHEKKLGQLFCDISSREIVELLQAECAAAKVEIIVDCRVNKLNKDASFQIETSLGTFESGSLVIATGGLSFPKLGANDFGYRIARQFGHTVGMTNPGLVPLLFDAEDQKTFAGLSGISLDVAVTANGKTFRENMLFTHRGLSGPAILQISNYLLGNAPLSINLMPDQNALPWLEGQRTSAKELKTVLGQILPQRFVQKWCDQYAPSRPLNRYTSGELAKLSQLLENWIITPAGNEGYAKAEVTLSGVDTTELSSKTMESRLVPGLYFIGEVVDVTGWLGGYNFQWAWASGHAAGQFV